MGRGVDGLLGAPTTATTTKGNHMDAGVKVALASLGLVAEAIAIGVVLTDGVPADQTFSEPVESVLYVENHAKGWGVAAAVKAWDASPVVDVRLTDDCEQRINCVVIKAADYGDSEWIGRHLGLTIALNSYYEASTYKVRQSTSCHELGHALGIDENYEVTGTCMEATVNEWVVPGKVGFELLEAVQ